MIRSICLATLLVTAAATVPASAKERRMATLDANGNLDALVTKHAAANNVPEDLVRRVIKRESGGNPRAVSKGNYGIMQIRLGTARGLGYRGTAAGLLDADTNMTYAVKYLAGAYQVAGGNHTRAVHYYAAGYYYAAKRRGFAARAQAGAMSRPALDGNGGAVMGADRFKSTAASPSARLRNAMAEGESVSSSSSLYSGRLDYH
jgi:soluble lytic murein transglycosylase-like protein